MKIALDYHPKLYLGDSIDGKKLDKLKKKLENRPLTTNCFERINWISCLPSFLSSVITGKTLPLWWGLPGTARKRFSWWKSLPGNVWRSEGTAR